MSEVWKILQYYFTVNFSSDFYIKVSARFELKCLIYQHSTLTLLNLFQVLIDKTGRLSFVFSQLYLPRIVVLLPLAVNIH